jgi:flavin reductase (DIM6/NTAB) family NADH-FMN oxidoreductase RutF
MNIKKYKTVLSKYATGVAVITKEISKNLTYGITVNSFVSISLKPSYISWSLDMTTSSYKNFKDIKNFNIYFLSSKQKNISNYFSSKNEEKKNSKIFKNLISKNLAKLYCKTVKKIKIGDHLVFVAEVIKLNLNSEQKPLLYYMSKYRNLSL